MIIHSIQKNAKTITQICSELGIHESTAYGKLKKLEDLKVVKKEYIIGERRRRRAKYKFDILEVSGN
ncbi:MAG: ArsR family transcriptional regulator [Nitrosotalea sp.]